MTLPPVLFDMETRSAVDLRILGSRRYAADESTQVMTLVCLIDNVYHCWYNPSLGWVKPPILDPARNWPDVATLDTAASRCRVYCDTQLPDAVRAAIVAGREFVAHNCYGFDALVWRQKLTPVPMLWGDTLPLARSGGMPGALDVIGRVLRGDGKHAGAKILHKWMHRSDKPPAPGDFAEIMKYNVDDVILLELLYKSLDDVSLEQDTVECDRAINARGIAVDVATVRAMQEVAIVCVERAGDEIEMLTRGALQRTDLRKVAKIRAWVQSHGAWLPNLRKETVERFINDPESFLESLDDSDELRDRVDVPPIVAQVLQLRTAATRITGAKLDSVLASIDADSRLRDMFVYHGAHTGRFTGRKVQLHNLPRPKKGIDAEKLLQSSLTYDAIRSQIPDHLQVDDAISSLLRPMFVAAEGHTLCIADFASVECRGVAWIADEESLLSVFHRGEDPYCWMASRIYGRTVTKKDATERQVGKITVLGAGYQLSEAKFGIYCAMQGIDLSAAKTTASECIGAFRDAFPAIAGYPSGTWQGRKVRRGGLWDQLSATAFAAVNGKPGSCGKCQFFMRGRNLIVTLPSQRELIYRNARIEDRVPGYCFTLKLEPVMKPTLVYNGPHGENTLYGGKLTENIVQAICRDLLCTGLIKCENLRLPVVLHVHDEIVSEVADAEADAGIRQLCQLMSTPPKWAEGFPIGVEGYTSRRYFKSPPKGSTEVVALCGKLTKVTSH